MQIAKPNRVTRTYTQRYNAGPDIVFPLMCPVREADWISEWDPLVVFSECGVVETDCVFLTESKPYNAIWYVTKHDNTNHIVEMLKITPTVTACKLTIAMTATAQGTDASVSYSHTSLGPEGDALVAAFTEEHYAGFMQEWEAQVNYFLAHGTALEADTQ